MNRNRNIQQHPTRTDQYALEGPRWWWTPAAGGAAAAMAVVAIVGTSSAGHAIPVDVDRYATTPASQLAPARPALAAAQDSPDIPDGYRQCFMWQSHWNTALDGAQPFCPEDSDGDEGHEGHERQARRTATGSDQAQAETVDELTDFSPRPSLAKWLPMP